MSYIDKNGLYYEGDRVGDDQIVPKRPDGNHIWNGSVWQALPAAVPEQVTMRQARLALLEAGKLTVVNSAVAAMLGAVGDAARVEWEFSSTVERHRPLVAALAGALNLSDAQLDALFIRAAEM